MSIPKNHHYIPQFYLKRWAGPDGKVFRFSRPHGDTVVGSRVSPKRTAYEEHLYSMTAPKQQPDPEMELGFMSHLDSEAARVLPLLERNRPIDEWSASDRSAWSRFVWSMMMRTPPDIEQIKSMVGEAWQKEFTKLQVKYEKERNATHPEKVEDFPNQEEPYFADSLALNTATKLMDHSGIGEIINNMHWRVLDFEGCGVELLTSDRPVWMTPTLLETNALILMPISPTKLFIASSDIFVVKGIAQENRYQYANNVNKLIVQHAVQFVFGGG